MYRFLRTTLSFLLVLFCCAPEVQSTPQAGSFFVRPVFPSTQFTPPSGNQFASALLKHLYEHFKLENETPTDVFSTTDRTISYYPIVVSGSQMTVKVEQDVRGIIQHVGFNFFTPQDRQTFEDVGVFLERYLLFLYSESEEQRKMHLTADRVDISYNDILFGHLGSQNLGTVIRVLSDPSNIRFSTQEYRIRFSCQDAEGNKLSIELPARFDLIRGMDKKELDEQLNTAIRELVPGVSQPSRPAPHEVSPYRNNVVQTQQTELYPGISSQRFFLPTNQIYIPVNDPDYPLESLKNILLAPPNELRKTLILDHQMYDREETVSQTDLGALVQFLSENHDIYVGFELLENNTIQSTQIFKNRTYATLHMLTINWPKNLHWSDTNTLNARLFTYIRHDNVKNLFGEYIEKLNRAPVRIEIND